MHFRYTGYGCIQHLLLSLQMPTSPCCRQLGFSNSLLTKVASALISIRISSTEDEKLGRFMFEKWKMNKIHLMQWDSWQWYIRNTFNLFLLQCVALMSLFSYGPMKVLLYLVNKDHSYGLVRGCIHRLWEAVVCVCVYISIFYVYDSAY